ncbi:MAG: ATPase, partial [Sphingobacteriales bacterium]
MDRFVVISGCSSGGKSSLLAELQRRGFDIVYEPGRRIVADEKERGGNALPWINLQAFLEKAIRMALEDRKAASQFAGTVFFDRCLIDAVIGLEHVLGRSIRENYTEERYNPR